jgi:hypothetical protein
LGLIIIVRIWYGFGLKQYPFRLKYGKYYANCYWQSPLLSAALFCPLTKKWIHFFKRKREKRKAIVLWRGNPVKLFGKNRALG